MQIDFACYHLQSLGLTSVIIIVVRNNFLLPFWFPNDKKLTKAFVWKSKWNHLSTHAKIEYKSKKNLAPLSDCLSQPASQPAAYLLVDSQLTQCRQTFYELVLTWSLVRLFQICKKIPILCRENKTGKALCATLSKYILSSKIYDQKSEEGNDSTGISSSLIKVENCTALEN